MKNSRKWLYAIAVGAGIVTAGQITVGQVTASAKVTQNSPYAVSVVLKPTDKQGMVNRVYDTADPTSDAFRQYYSPAQVASHYGRSNADINKFKNYFKKYHVSVSAYPGNLFLKVNGLYKNVKRSFKAKVKGNHTVYTLPKNLKSQVSSVMGLVGKYKLLENPTGGTNYKVPTSGEKPALNTKKATFSKKYGQHKFADRYKLNKLYDNGLSGNGQHIAVMSWCDFYLKDIQKYLKQNGQSTNVSRIHKIYLGSKKASRISMLAPGLPVETSLDVEQAASVAPGADIDVYIMPILQQKMTPDLTLFSMFNSAVSDNLAKQITSSLAYGNEVYGMQKGLSETTAQYEAAYNLLYEQAALQGQTVFTASGDHGPYVQPGRRFNFTTSTSPYQVSVGGTTLPYNAIRNGRIIDINKERAWGDIATMNANAAKMGAMYPGSGGGFSRYNATPRYQLGVPGVNTFTAIEHLKFKNGGYVTLTQPGYPGVHLTSKGSARYQLVKNPKIIHGKGSGRNLPDIAGNADPHTGYAEYSTDFHLKNQAAHGYWRIVGGTSVTAPQMAAASAVMNSGLGTSTGFWNPQIYKFAQESDSPFTPLDSMRNNDNLYYAGTPGKLYNQATGLGTVNFEKLFEKFNSK